MPLPLESALKPEELEELTQAMIRELKTVFDPEIPVDIYELGLIYKIGFSAFAIATFTCSAAASVRRSAFGRSRRTLGVSLMR